MRSAWRIAPAATSSWRASPARIGSPAASADVQPAGRSALERRSKTRAAVRVPARALPLGGVELVELALALAHHEHMAVAAVLDRRVERDRVRAGLGLVGLVEADGHARLAGGDRHVRDAVLARAAEVGPQRSSRRGTCRCSRPAARPARCPCSRVVGREHRAAADERAAAGDRAPARRGRGRPARAARRPRRSRARRAASRSACGGTAAPCSGSARRRHPAVGPRRAPGAEPLLAPGPPDHAARLAARAVLPGQLDRAGQRGGLQLARPA